MPSGVCVGHWMCCRRKDRRKGFGCNRDTSMCTPPGPSSGPLECLGSRLTAFRLSLSGQLVDTMSAGLSVYPCGISKGSLVSVARCQEIHYCAARQGQQFEGPTVCSFCGTGPHLPDDIIHGGSELQVETCSPT